jgi:hypothetical protein
VPIAADRPEYPDRQGGVKLKLRVTSLGLGCVLPVQPADVHDPDSVPGDGWLIDPPPLGGIVPVQPPAPTMGPESDAVAVPDTPVGTMVPATMPLSAHRWQATENGMEKTPLLLTTVVPEAGAAHDPLTRGTTTLSA